jgi:hypothetical protein
MRRRVVLLALLATSLVVGAGAFTSVATDRGVAVDVVSDENAYLSLTEYYSVASPGGETERPAEDEVNTLAVDGSEGTIFEVTNQFTVDLHAVSANAESRHSDLTVTIDDAEHTPADLGVGETGAIQAESECDAPVREAKVDVTVTVAGDGVEATRYDKTVTVSCVGAPKTVPGRSRASAGASETTTETPGQQPTGTVTRTDAPDE